MNEEAFSYLKKEFDQRKDERDKAEEHFCSLLAKRNKLERNPIIVKYLKLVEEINSSTGYFANNDDLLKQSFATLVDSGFLTETNEIYFYCGSFIKDNGDIIQVARNSKNAKYDLYKNIESCRTIANPIDEREEFENTHKVIVFPKPFPSPLDFNDVHRDYLYTSLNESQEEACAKVLSRKF